MSVSNACLQLPSLKIRIINLCFIAINGSGPADLSELLPVYTPRLHYALTVAPACSKSSNTNGRFMALALCHALDPTFGIHSHGTLDIAQPCHLLKHN